MIDTLILDAGPLITQSFSELSTLATNFVTTPSVAGEIRDERARQNLQLWGDKLKLRQPKPQAVKFVTEFSKKTGDYSALSSTDLHILALCYEVECELNNGDWRLRNVPGQKTINRDVGKERPAPKEPQQEQSQEREQQQQQQHDEPEQEQEQEQEPEQEDDDGFTVVTKKKKNRSQKQKQPVPREDEHIEVIMDEDDDDGEGWIGPEDDAVTAEQKFGDQSYESKVRDLKAAMSSGDFAMQNVALQIGLNLVNPTNGLQIKKVKNYMLRCHACFKLCQLPKDGKPLQFCPKCGLDSLLRCTVSVGDNGQIQVHLKKNMQWITRGNKYSLPSPQSKNARRVQRPDNKNAILLREDQKEYQQAVKHDMWKKKQNEKILDEWVGSGSADSVMTPFAISGYKRDATRHTGVRVGRGRHVNAASRRRN